MNFVALPIKIGDSFLLRTNSGIFLVDGGQDRSHINTLLAHENISNFHLNVLICTHYDADHISGILGILKGKRYTFDEIWLPEILGSLSYTISEDLFGILEKLRSAEERDSARFTENKSIYELECNRSDFDSNISPANIELINLRVHGSHSLLLYDLLLWKFQNLSMAANLFALTNCVAQSLTSGAHVRWFSFRNKPVNYSCGYDMFALNAEETGVTRYNPISFLIALYLTTINKTSLVFKYDSGQYPNVLFSADSDLSFTNTKIALKDRSIVTAPHHGSESCKNAYTIIGGRDHIFIRSDKSQITRPGPSYLKQKERYCTICRNKGPKQKIGVYCSATGTVVNGNACTC